MRLFYKRPLALILCIMLGGLLLFTRCSELFRIFTVIFVSALLVIFIITVIKKNTKFIFLISAVALLVSIIFSYFYFDKWFYAAKRFDDEVFVEATVCEELKATTYSKKYSVKTDNINGEDNSSYKFILYVDKTISDRFTVGDVIKFKCTISDFNGEYAQYNYAKGYSGSLEDVEEITVTERDRFVYESALGRLREIIARYAMLLSDTESGSMLAALLLGERDMLSGQVRLDFKRLGITHLLALSGLHLAILSLGIEKLLKLLRLKEKPRIIITIIFTLLYMALTGFPVSVRRAGIMLIFTKLLNLFLRDSDSVTSLFVATAVICFTTPYSVYDISLWLSAFATLGVIVFSEFRTDEENKTKNKFIQNILESLLVSGFAITATLFITQFSFSGLSILSPVATLIFSILVELIMYIGTAMLIIGKIIPLGLILTPIVKLTTEISEMFSSFDIFVSKDYKIIDVIVILLTLSFLLFIILGLKHKKKAAYTVMGLLILVFVTAGVLNIVEKYDDKVIYYSEESKDAFLIKSDTETALISSARYSQSSGYSSVDIIESQRLHTLDKYIVSHYSWSLSDEFNVLLSSISVKNIYLPEPKNDDEATILNKIYSVTDDYRTEIHLIDSYHSITVGEYTFRYIYTTPYGSDTAQSVYMFYNDTESYAYLSSGILSGKGQYAGLDTIKRAENVIFGAHGKKYKLNTYFEAEYTFPENLIFSSRNLSIPPDTLKYYIEKGCEIHSHPKEFVLAD